MLTPQSLPLNLLRHQTAGLFTQLYSVPSLLRVLQSIPSGGCCCCCCRRCVDSSKTSRCELKSDRKYEAVAVAFTHSFILNSPAAYKRFGVNPRLYRSVGRKQPWHAATFTPPLHALRLILILNLCGFGLRTPRENRQASHRDTVCPHWESDTGCWPSSCEATTLTATPLCCPHGLLPWGNHVEKTLMLCWIKVQLLIGWCLNPPPSSSPFLPPLHHVHLYIAFKISGWIFCDVYRVESFPSGDLISVLLARSLQAL